MIQFPKQDRLHARGDLTEIHEPAEPLVHLARDHDLDAERVPVHAKALVVLGHHGKAMRRLEAELLDQLDAHVSTSLRSGHAYRVGSGTPASRKPRARSRQLSHAPHASPSSVGS